MQFYLEIADVANLELPLMSAAEGLYTFLKRALVLYFIMWQLFYFHIYCKFIVNRHIFLFKEYMEVYINGLVQERHIHC